MLLWWFHKRTPVSEEHETGSESILPSITTLIDHLIGQISTPTRAASVLASISRFQALAPIEKEKELPAIYLFLEQYLVEVAPHKSLPEPNCVRLCRLAIHFF